MFEVRTYFQARPAADAHPGLLHMLNKFLGSFDSHVIELPIVVAMLRYFLPEQTLCHHQFALWALLPFNQKKIHPRNDPG
jgi:hypothetical protein